MKSKKSCFDTRQKNEEIVFAGQSPASSGSPIPTGSSVTLHSGDARIRVAITDAGTNDAYQGSVLDIQNADDANLPGVSVGGDVQFTTANIFTCESIAAAA